MGPIPDKPFTEYITPEQVFTVQVNQRIPIKNIRFWQRLKFSSG
jgi:hypothetical protein